MSWLELVLENSIHNTVVYPIIGMKRVCFSKVLLLDPMKWDEGFYK